MRKKKDGEELRKETGVQIYLFLFSFFFSFFKLFPMRKKSIFIVYLGYNALYTIEELEKRSKERIIICYSKSTQVKFDKKNNRTVMKTSNKNIINWIRMIYHLATSDNVVVDNYYIFLAKSKFKKGVLCIQLWHAAGAMKKFALLDNSLEKRPKITRKRFEKAYNRFTHVVAGAEEMGEIFTKCFGISKEKILYTGVPRTDLFYNEEKQKESKENIRRNNKEIIETNKKIILYTPTFRDEQMIVNESALNIKTLYQELKNEYILLVKTHPSVKNKISNEYSDFVKDVSDYKSINDLLLIADILITDYSSIPCEYAFLNRPMIFYAHDLEEYSKRRGTWKDYKSTSPGEVVHTTDEVLEVIKRNQYNYEKIKEYKELWNKYSDGKSSKRIIDFIMENRKATK